MKPLWSKPASDELEEKALWYEKKEEGLGLDFIKEVERALGRVLLDPEAPRVFEVGCRRVFAKHFPYSVIYRLKGDRVQIIAVMAHKMKPGYWHDRLE